jgi:hypothetical protein
MNPAPLTTPIAAVASAELMLGYENSDGTLVDMFFSEDDPTGD